MDSVQLKEILELAGAIQVKGYSRVTKGGKSVRVGAYTRSPIQVMGDMIKKAADNDKPLHETELRQRVRHETGAFPTRHQLDQAQAMATKAGVRISRSASAKDTGLAKQRGTKEYLRSPEGHGKAVDVKSKPEADREAPRKGGKPPKNWAAGIAKNGRANGKGTVQDPIDVGHDLERAVELLAEGKHVRLRQVKEVSTLVDKLREISAEMVAKGDKAPDFDLCKITVKKTNLFCVQSKGHPRAKMPQLSGVVKDDVPAAAYRKDPNDSSSEADISEGFIEALQAQGIALTDKRVPASHLRASQNQLDGPKVGGIAGAMKAGKVKDKPIFVTRDGYVIDGHHRWAAKVAQDTEDGNIGEIDMPVRELDMDIGQALDFANAFALSMGIRPKGLGAAAEAVQEKAEGAAEEASTAMSEEQRANLLATMQRLRKER